MQVCQAVEALQQHHGTMKSRRKPQLVEENPTISLIIALRKIPDRSIRPHRMYARQNNLIDDKYNGQFLVNVSRAAAG